MTQQESNDLPQIGESLEDKLKRLTRSVLIGEISNHAYEMAVAGALQDAPLDELTGGLAQRADNPDAGNDF